MARIKTIDAFRIAVGLPVPESYDCKFTYAITDGSFIKVGRTWHLPRRLIAIQTAYPRAISVLGWLDFDAERSVHLAMAVGGVRRVVGEWFDDTKVAREILKRFDLIGGR